ncbi:MAG: nitroreductase family protein [Bacteroidota bacterium]|jgi:nitroreductase
MNKIAQTKFPVSKIISKRWSPRAFSKSPVTKNEVLTLLEAASWAPSASNEQPWHFYFGLKNTDGFRLILNGLEEGNKVWAQNSSALIVCCVKKISEKTGKENKWANHDLGLANATLLYQAMEMDIYCHPMAGFNGEALIKNLNIDSACEPLVVIALGHLGNADELDEPLKSREKLQRSRKNLEEILTEVKSS